MRNGSRDAPLPRWMIGAGFLLSGDIVVHKDKVADAAAHDKEMEDLMGTEVLVSGIKKGQFQGVDHAARRINKAACEKPEKGRHGQGEVQGAQGEENDPPHGNVQNGGKPFRTSHPAQLKEHADDGNGPNDGEQTISQCVLKNGHAHGGIGACDQHEDHHVIEPLKDL